LVYNRGFTIAAIQHAELPAFAKTAGDNSKYVTALLQMIFGIEVLAVSSITDKAKKNCHINPIVQEKAASIKKWWR
jgi:hypothetical protein